MSTNLKGVAAHEYQCKGCGMDDRPTYHLIQLNETPLMSETVI